MNQNVVKAVLVAGLQANLGYVKMPGVKGTFALGNRPDAIPSAFSLLSTFEVIAFDTIRLVAFGQFAAVNDSYMRHVTAITPITAALFGGSLSKASKGAAPVVDKFMPLRISVWADGEADEPSKEKVWQVLKQFRKTLDQVLNIAFGNVASNRRGDSATSGESTSVVAKFMTRWCKYWTLKPTRRSFTTRKPRWLVRKKRRRHGF